MPRIWRRPWLSGSDTGREVGTAQPHGGVDDYEGNRSGSEVISKEVSRNNLLRCTWSGALVTSQMDLQPAWAEQGFIEKLRSIREADHEHIAACGHPVHLRQELVHDAVRPEQGVVDLCVKSRQGVGSERLKRTGRSAGHTGEQ